MAETPKQKKSGSENPSDEVTGKDIRDAQKEYDSAVRELEDAINAQKKTAAKKAAIMKRIEEKKRLLDEEIRKVQKLSDEIQGRRPETQQEPEAKPQSQETPQKNQPTIPEVQKPKPLPFISTPEYSTKMTTEFRKKVERQIDTYNKWFEHDKKNLENTDEWKTRRVNILALYRRYSELSPGGYVPTEKREQVEFVTVIEKIEEELQSFRAFRALELERRKEGATTKGTPRETTTNRAEPVAKEPALPRRKQGPAKTTETPAKNTVEKPQPGPKTHSLETRESRALFTEVVTKDFERYQNTITADKDLLGDSPRWNAYYEQSMQLFDIWWTSIENWHFYEQDGEWSGRWPTDKKKRAELIRVAGELHILLDRYEKVRPSLKPPEKAKEKQVNLVERNGEFKSWIDHMKDNNARYDAIREKYRNKVKTTQEYLKYHDTVWKYYHIYDKYRLSSPRDNAMCAVITNQIDDVITRYENVFEKMTNEQPKKETKEDAEEKPKPNMFGGFLNTIKKGAALAENKVRKSVLSDPKARKVAINAKYSRYKGGDTIALHTALLQDADEGTFHLSTDAKEAEKQLEGILYMKAHLPEVAGKKLEGESTIRFNQADIDAVAKSVVDDKLKNHAQEVYQQVVEARASEGQPLNAEEKKGVRIALGLEGIPAEDLRNLNKARRMNRSGLGRFFLKLAGKYDDYLDGERKLARIGEVRQQIIRGAYSEVASEMMKAFAENHISPDRNSSVDRSARSVTLEDLVQLRTHVEAMGTIGKEDLATVGEASGAAITTFSPSGIGMNTIEWMLDAVNAPEGRNGRPPGSTFYIERMEEHYIAQKQKQEEEKAKKQTTQETADEPKEESKEQEVSAKGAESKEKGVIHVSSEEELKEELAKSTKPTVVEFTTKGCVACKNEHLIAAVNALSENYRIIVAEFYFDKKRDEPVGLSQSFLEDQKGWESHPAFSFYKKGELVQSADFGDEKKTQNVDFKSSTSIKNYLAGALHLEESPED